MNNNDERDYEEENANRALLEELKEEDWEYEMPADYLSELKTDFYFSWKKQHAEWGF